MTANMYKFSIIIPVYNVAPYLRECLDSVVNQTFTDWEAICVDDGSTDGSSAVLDEYSEMDKRVKVIHQKNQGVSAARNCGIDCACGEYVIFVDGDDACVIWMLECLNYALDSSGDVDFINFGHQSVRSMTDALPKRMSVNDRLRIITINSESSARDAYFNIAGVMLAWGGCYRRSSIDAIRFKPYPNGEDALFAFECLINARCIAITSVVLYRYRLPRPGSANTMSLKNLRSCCAVGKEYHKALSHWKYRDSVCSIERRKNRSRLYGIKYNIVRRVAAWDRQLAWGIMRDDLYEVSRFRSDTLPLWDMIIVKVSAIYNSRLIFHVFGYWPFMLRVLILRMPCVERLKTMIRSIIAKVNGLLLCAILLDLW